MLPWELHRWRQLLQERSSQSSPPAEPLTPSHQIYWYLQHHKSEAYLEAYINNVIFNLNIGSKYKNVCHTVSIFQCFLQDQSIPCILLQHNAFLQLGIMFWEPGYRGAGYHMKIKHVSLFPASDFFRNTFHWIIFLICDKHLQLKWFLIFTLICESRLHTLFFKLFLNGWRRRLYTKHLLLRSITKNYFHYSVISRMKVYNASV